MDWRSPAICRAVDQWLEEDIGRGDLTAPALQGRQAVAHWVSKSSGRFCGGPGVEQLFQRLDPAARMEWLVGEGAAVQAGDRLVEIRGSASALVGAERAALNLAMHLSGIASATAELVSQLAGTGVQLADTRKTTPGLRVLEKYAVRCGGGCNHRMGLDDAAMLKENHLAWAGSMENAIQLVRAQAPWPVRVIVEAETDQQAEQAIRAGADAVLLDEFTPEQLQKLIPQLRALASRPVVLEASGVQPEQLRAYASTGIDLISTSAPVTRSRWLDLSMRFG